MFRKLLVTKELDMAEDRITSQVKLTQTNSQGVDTIELTLVVRDQSHASAAGFLIKGVSGLLEIPKSQL